MDLEKKATVTADGNKQPIIINDVIIRPIKRENGDLKKWKSAAQSAESSIPRRVAIYDMYADYATRDAQIIACWNKRLDPILSAPWEFTDKEGNPVDVISQLIDCVGFEDLLTEIMNSKAWGYSMCEPAFFINDNGQNEFALYSVPKKHMRPHTGIIAREQNGNEGINIREGIYAKSIMEFGKVDDLGLLLSATMYSILKAGNLSDWAEFIEIFGRGVIDAVWDGFDPAQKAELQKGFEELGGSGIIIRPKGTEVSMVNNTGNANGDLQNKFTDKMDDYIAKALLGSTETTGTSKTSGYAQSKVHQEGDEKKSETDLNFVRRNLNSRFTKVMRANGLDTKGGTFILKQTKKIDKKAQFDIHKSMAKDLNIPIEDDFFYEEYGMPRPENYEALKKEALERSNVDLNNKAGTENAPTPPSSKGKKGEKPTVAEDKDDKEPTALRRLLRLFHSASVSELNPIAEADKMGCCGEAHTINVTLNGAQTDIEEFALEMFAKQVWEAKGVAFIYPELFYYNAEQLLQGFESGWEATEQEAVQLADLGFEYGYTNPKIQTAWELNLFKFSAIRAAYQSTEVNAVFRRSKSFDEFYRTLKKTHGVSDKNRLRTEYDTANAAGESAATYYRLLGKTKTFKYWKYMTQQDGKVRKEHQKLHGCIFKWDDPIWDLIMPPNGWNCRCYIVGMLESEVTQAMLNDSIEKATAFFETEEWARTEKNGFAHNMANTKEVFNESQQYSGTPDKVLENVGKMYYDDWGMKPILERQALAENDWIKPVFEVGKTNKYTKKLMTDAEQAAESFFKKIGLNKKIAIVTDYKDRDITVNRHVITNHINDKYPDYTHRHLYIKDILEVINNPDEVWIRNHTIKNDPESTKKFNNYVYIKYYKNKILNVIAKLSNNGDLELSTWYDIIVGDGTGNNKMQNDLFRHRRGLPVKK